MIHRTIPPARRTSATTQHVPYRPSPRPDKRASNEKASSPLNSARYPPPSRQQVRSQRQPANGTTHASFRRTNTSQTPVVQRSVRINPGRTPQYATPSPSVVSARNSTMGFSNGTNHQSLWSASNPLQGQSPSHEMPEDASSTIAHTLASSVAAPSTAATGNDEGSVSVPLPVSMAIINNSNKTSSNITRGILRQSLSVSDVIMCAPVIFGSTAPILWKGIESPAAPTISSSRGPGRSYPTPRRHSFITAIQTVRRPRASSDAHQHRIPSPETSMSIAAPNDVCKYPPEGVNDEEDSKSVETVVAAIRPTVQTQWDDGQANSAAPISATASMTRSSPSERLRNRMQRVILVLDSVGLHILNYTENSNSVANSFSNSGASNPSTPIQRSLLSPMELAFFPRTRIGKTQSLDPATSSFDAAICPAIETDSLSPPSSPYARSVKWSFVLKIVTVDGFTSILYFDDAMHRNAVQKVIIAHCRLPLPVAGPHHRTRSYSRKSSGAIGASNVDASHPRSVSQAQRESVPPSRLFSDETGNGNEDVHSRSDSMVRDSAARGNLYPHNINVPDSVLDRLRRRLQRSMTSMDSLPHVEPQELTGVGRTTGHSSNLSQSSSTAPSINARGVVYAQVIVKTQAHAPSDSNALECDADGFELPSRPVHSSSVKSAVAPNVRIAPPDVTIRTQQPVVPSQLHNQPPTATAILVEREPQTINVQQRFHPSHTYQADFSTYPHASDAHTLYARKDPVAVPVVTSRFTALEKRLEEARARRGLMNLA